MRLTMSVNVNSSHFERVGTTPYISRCCESIWHDHFISLQFFYKKSIAIIQDPDIESPNASVLLECMYYFLPSLKMLSWCLVAGNKPSYSGSTYCVTTELVTKLTPWSSPPILNPHVDSWIFRFRCNQSFCPLSSMMRFHQCHKAHSQL